MNLLAANLTNQVRAIADVATAVTKGDLTRSIQVEARGEVAELKDNINTMIDNLRGTTDRNQEQDWLKTNLAKFTRMLQGQRDLVTVGQMLLSELAPLVDAQQGTIYQMERERPGREPRPVVEDPPPPRGYAPRADQPERIALGVGLVGQAAAEKQRILLNDVPPGLHDHPLEPRLGAADRASSSSPCSSRARRWRSSSWPRCGRSPTPTSSSSISSRSRSASCSTRSRRRCAPRTCCSNRSSSPTELQTRQIELQQTNEELASKAKQLAEQNEEVERKNKEVEQARRALEEKAAELALTSKYKSEFLANMSHELRTPLNSILILGQQLAENVGGNLTGKQVDFAKNIHSAGTDLLTLINDILDLSKIESGTVTVEPEEITLRSACATPSSGCSTTSRRRRALGFNVDFDPSLPRALVSDPKRLQQILKNLLSNAFKFTAQGSVAMAVRHGDVRLERRSPRPERAPARRSPSWSPTPESASRPRSRSSSSRRSSRPTPARAASTAARASASRSAASWRTCSAARSASQSKPGSREHLHALPAAHLHRAGPAPALRSGTSATTTPSAVPVLSVAKVEETVPDDREKHPRRRHGRS